MSQRGVDESAQQKLIDSFIQRRRKEFVDICRTRSVRTVIPKHKRNSLSSVEIAGLTWVPVCSEAQFLLDAHASMGDIIIETNGVSHRCLLRLLLHKHSTSFQNLLQLPCEENGKRKYRLAIDEAWCKAALFCSSGWVVNPTKSGNVSFESLRTMLQIAEYFELFWLRTNAEVIMLCMIMRIVTLKERTIKEIDTEMKKPHFSVCLATLASVVELHSNFGLTTFLSEIAISIEFILDYISTVKRKPRWYSHLTEIEHEIFILTKLYTLLNVEEDFAVFLQLSHETQTYTLQNYLSMWAKTVPWKVFIHMDVISQYLRRAKHLKLSASLISFLDNLVEVLRGLIVEFICEVVCMPLLDSSNISDACSLWNSVHKDEMRLWMILFQKVISNWRQSKLNWDMCDRNIQKILKIREDDDPLHFVRRRDLLELKSFSHPPQSITLLLEILLILLNPGTSTRRMASLQCDTNMLLRLKRFDERSVHPEKMKKVHEMYSSSNCLAPISLRRVSAAARGISMWLQKVLRPADYQPKAFGVHTQEPWFFLEVLKNFVRRNIDFFEEYSTEIESLRGIIASEAPPAHQMVHQTQPKLTHTLNQFSHVCVCHDICP